MAWKLQSLIIILPFIFRRIRYVITFVDCLYIFSIDIFDIVLHILTSNTSQSWKRLFADIPSCCARVISSVW
jgi:hypothetical protein